MPGWTAEIEVGAALVGRLLRQFPTVAGAPVRRLSEGWDRSVWLVADTWVFGFPRRAAVLPGMAREVEFLPRLAPNLPLPVPVPVFLGRPDEGYPWPFWGAEFVPGAESCAFTAGTGNAIEPLAGFLRALHDPALAATVGAGALPVDVNARADMARRVPLARTQLDEIADLWRAPPEATRILAEAEALPPADPAPATLVHGDLHFRHVLLGRGGHPSGILDWVDLCRADPSVDLQLVWSFFDPPERVRFLAAYGPVRPASLLRARVFALSVNAALAAYGHAEGLPHVERAALAALSRAGTG